MTDPANQPDATDARRWRHIYLGVALTFALYVVALVVLEKAFTR